MMTMASSTSGGSPTRSGSTIVAARSYQVITIDGYSRSLNTHQQPGSSSRPSFNSRSFRAGGRTWHVSYRPMGSPGRPENTDSIALYLVLDDAVDLAGDEAAVTTMAQVTFSLLDQRSIDRDREAVHMYTVTTTNNDFSVRKVWGIERFIRRRDLELYHLKDDRFAIRVHVHLRNETPCVVVPPPDIRRNIGDLLPASSSSSREATPTTTDVEFRVGDETFAAHRLVLGARSPVFRAELFGPMKEGGTATITTVIQIDEMEPRVFGCLLAFMYTDAWPPEIMMEDDDDDESAVVMAQHLLAAADRYGLQRLKLMCEERLLKRIDAGSVASVLALAEQHQCPGLKRACFHFLGFSSEAFLDAIETQGFEYLARSCPAIVRELISGLLARDLEKRILGELSSRVPLFRGL